MRKTIRATRKQAALLSFLDDLFSGVGLDYRATFNRLESTEHRTAELERVRDHLIRSEIITTFIIAESALDRDIARLLLRLPENKALRGSKPFNSLVALIGRMNVEQKLRILRMVRRVPIEIRQILTELNKKRNAAAHQLVLREKRKPMTWRGISLESQQGIRKYWDDEKKLWKFFLGVSPMF